MAGWIREGIYHFTVEEVMTALSCGNKKAVSLLAELEQKAGLIGMIKTDGHEKNYELIGYVSNVNGENAEVLME